MRVWIGCGLGMVVVSGMAWGSEPSCYRSVGEAAAQTGVRGVAGYRLEGLRKDVFSGAVWATVRSCGHPERPGVLVMAAAGIGAGSEAGSGQRSEWPAERAIVLFAGTRVRVVATDETARIEMMGVAQASGAVGDRVRVRLVSLSADESFGQTERFATGIVRSRDVVEMETR